MILICWCLCFANREESTATIRGGSETFLTPLWLFQPVMDCSKYKCVICNVFVCICVYFSANIASCTWALLPFIHQVSACFGFCQLFSVYLYFLLPRLSFIQTGSAYTSSLPGVGIFRVCALKQRGLLGGMHAHCICVSVYMCVCTLYCIYIYMYMKRREARQWPCCRAKMYYVLLNVIVC